MNKRVMALLLSAALVLGQINGIAFAGETEAGSIAGDEPAEQDVIEDSEYTEGVEETETTDAPEYEYEYVETAEIESYNDAAGDQIPGNETDTIKYMDYDVATGKFYEADAPADIKIITDGITEVTEDSKTKSVLASGWYYVEGQITITNRVFINSSEVHLILKDGSELKCENGIGVDKDSSFTVYGQEAGTGELTCRIGSDYCGYAALGGNTNERLYGKITINGGKIDADSSYFLGETYSDWAAGIGGARCWNDGGPIPDTVSSSITINGGQITACRGYGGNSSSIGGGRYSYPGTITIRGGNITALGTVWSIGNGTAGSLPNYDATINISWNDPNMSIEAWSFSGNVYLEDYFKNSDGTIYIGELNDSQKMPPGAKTIFLTPCEAVKVTYESGIDQVPAQVKYYEGSSYDLTLPDATELFQNPGKEFLGWQIGSGTELKNKGDVINVTGELTVTATWGTPTVSYVDAKGNDMADEECYSISSSTTSLNASESQWYAVMRDTTIDSRLTVTGDVNIILTDGATLTAPNGITVSTGNSLTIWQQERGTGSLVIDSPKLNYSGIGGYYDSSSDTSYPCGTIEINGGNLDVTSGVNCAAIGGAYRDDGLGAIITINGGNVTASVDENCGGAAIGGGYEGALGTVNITGGTITANGASNAAIGSGSHSHNDADSVGTISISGGKIFANSTSANGIGGSYNAGYLQINISGGHIITTGIGVDKNDSASAINLSWTDPDMSIKSDSFNKAPVILLSSFKVADEGTVYDVGTIDDVSAIAGKKLIPCSDTSIAGHSLTLDGRIGVNFFVSIPEGQTPGSMTFDISGRGNIETKDGYEVRDGNYVYTCYITSIQMADTITATYTGSDGKIITEYYSVSDYIAYFDGHQSEFKSETIDLIKALADYGHYVQPFLSAKNNWSLDPDTGYAEMTKYYRDSFEIDNIRSSLENVSVQADLTGSGVTASYSLRMDSTTELDIYLAGDSDIDLSGCQYPVSLCADGRYMISIKNIVASDLDKNITISGNNEGFSITLNPLCYIKARLSGADDNGVHNAMAALYSYYSAADAYVGGN